MEKLRDYDKDVLLKWFFYHLSMKDRHAISLEHPEAYNRYVGEEVVQVIGLSDNLAAYWTVVIPYQAEHRGCPWFPHEEKGPFSTLSRGAFRSEEQALAWIAASLPKGAKYEIKKIV